MAKTPSTMLDLGTAAPDFSLPNVDGKTISRKDFSGKPLLVMFICNHCPFVIHVRSKLAEIGRIYQEKGMSVIGINANDVTTYPDDSPDKMKMEARSAGYNFPYLFDATQAVAKAYEAACTPDFYLFDKNHKLVYRGQLDDSRPGNSIPVTGKDLIAALEATLKNNPVPTKQKPSIGCNIKWKAGNEPDYYNK